MELLDSLGLLVGRIYLVMDMIVEVDNGKYIDAEGYVKIFPIGINLHLYTNNPEIRIIIYAGNTGPNTGPQLILRER